MRQCGGCTHCKKIQELKTKCKIPSLNKDLIIGNATDFSYLDLSNLDFSKSHPKGVTFYGCNLDNCTFIDGCLCGFDVRNASVKNCIFKDYHSFSFDRVKGADFTGSDFGDKQEEMI